MTEDLRGLCDFETSDSELEDLMIRHFEGEFNEKYHRILIKPDGSETYRFMHLSTIYALKFIDNYCEGREYTLKRSSDRRILKRQRVQWVPLNTMN